jgi:hypothetical protein
MAMWGWTLPGHGGRFLAGGGPIFTFHNLATCYFCQFRIPSLVQYGHGNSREVLPRGTVSNTGEVIPRASHFLPVAPARAASSPGLVSAPLFLPQTNQQFIDFIPSFHSKTRRIRDGVERHPAGAKGKL